MIDYYLGYQKLSDLGIYVQSSTGVLDLPKLKTPPQRSWNEYHGVSVDLRKKRYESREINLSCFMKAENNMRLVLNLNNALYGFFKSKGTQQLRIFIDNDRPLVYQVYCQDKIEIKKQWRVSSSVFATFNLKLIEPEPEKVVIKFTTQNATIKIITSGFVNVNWGDYTEIYDITGSTITHQYPPHRPVNYAVVSGNPEDFNIETNGEVIWS